MKYGADVDSCFWQEEWKKPDLHFHLKQLKKNPIKYAKYAFQTLDIRQCEAMTPERREMDKTSHVTARCAARRGSTERRKPAGPSGLPG